MKIIGVAAGLFALFAILISVQILGPLVHPMPPGVDPRNLQVMCDWLSDAPFPVSLLVLAGWFLAAFGGSIAAFRIAKWYPAPWIVALVGSALAAWIATQFYPANWLRVAVICAPPLAVLLMLRMLRGPQRADASTTQ